MEAEIGSSIFKRTQELVIQSVSKTRKSNIFHLPEIAVQTTGSYCTNSPIQKKLQQVCLYRLFLTLDSVSFWLEALLEL